MGWMFELIPTGSDGYDASYSEEAVREMEQYVRNLPAVYQRSNGCYVLAQNEESRDLIVGSGRIDEPHDYLEHIYISREHVELSLEMDGFRIQDVIRFLEWSMKRWPATLLGETLGALDLPRFVASMVSSSNK